MKKKIMIAVPLIILCVIGIVFIILKLSAEEKAGYYEYPENDFSTAEQYLAACRIDDEILKKMSDEELAQAIADFPFLADIYTSSSVEPLSISRILEEESDAYQELLTREGCIEALSEKADELAQAGEDIKAEELSCVITAAKAALEE